MPQPELNIADIREEYRMAALDERAAGSDPVAFFHKWFAEAVSAHITEVNAMTLATVDAAHRPHSRIVLLKALDESGFTFFTNYQSAKGLDMEANPYAAIVFFWKELQRQVRVEGVIEKIAGAESDAYFNSRPEASRIGAWASPQSQPITDREILDHNYDRYQEQFSGMLIPRPPHWGGYRLLPESIEFWQGRASRMHDRILFTKSKAGAWERSRLAP